MLQSPFVKSCAPCDGLSLLFGARWCGHRSDQSDNSNRQQGIATWGPSGLFTWGEGGSRANICNALCFSYWSPCTTLCEIRQSRTQPWFCRYPKYVLNVAVFSSPGRYLQVWGRRVELDQKLGSGAVGVLLARSGVCCPAGSKQRLEGKGQVCSRLSLIAVWPELGKRSGSLAWISPFVKYRLRNLPCLPAGCEGWWIRLFGSFSVPPVACYVINRVRGCLLQQFPPRNLYPPFFLQSPTVFFGLHFLFLDWSSTVWLVQHLPSFTQPFFVFAQIFLLFSVSCTCPCSLPGQSFLSQLLMPTAIAAQGKCDRLPSVLVTPPQDILLLYLRESRARGHSCSSVTTAAFFSWCCVPSSWCHLQVSSFLFVFVLHICTIVFVGASLRQSFLSQLGTRGLLQPPVTWGNPSPSLQPPSASRWVWKPLLVSSDPHAVPLPFPHALWLHQELFLTCSLLSSHFFFLFSTPLRTWRSSQSFVPKQPLTLTSVMSHAASSMLHGAAFLFLLPPSAHQLVRLDRKPCGRAVFVQHIASRP